ncbi:MAG: hypothetical protein N2450_09665 [bacterium]|nr:hypothetical protein [bacterium]
MHSVLLLILLVSTGTCNILDVTKKDTTQSIKPDDTIQWYIKNFNLKDTAKYKDTIQWIAYHTDTLKFVLLHKIQKDTITISFTTTQNDTKKKTLVIPHLRLNLNHPENDTFRWNKTKNTDDQIYIFEIAPSKDFKNPVIKDSTKDTFKVLDKKKHSHKHEYFARVFSIVGKDTIYSNEVKFSVPISFWKRWWWVLILILGLVIVLLYILPKHRKKSENTDLNSQSSSSTQHQDGKQNNGIVNLSQSKVILKHPNNSAADIKPPITFEWDGSGYNEFELQIAEDENFQTCIVKEKIKDGYQKELSLNELQSGKTYYWRVIPITFQNNTQFSSEVYSFSIYKKPPPKPILVSPQNEATQIQTQTIDFCWNSNEETATYEFQLSEDQEFTSNVRVFFTNDKSTIISDLLRQKNYYWRVRCKNDAGESEWSDVFTFQTQPINISEVLQFVLNYIADYWQKVSEDPKRAKDENWYLPIKKELQQLAEREWNIQNIYYNLDELWKYSANPKQEIPFKPHRSGYWVFIPKSSDQYYVIPMDHFLFTQSDGIGYVGHLYSNIDRSKPLDIELFHTMRVVEPAEFKKTDHGFLWVKQGVITWDDKRMASPMTQKQESFPMTHKLAKQIDEVMNDKIKELQNKLKQLNSEMDSNKKELQSLTNKLAQLSIQMTNSNSQKVFDDVQKDINEIKSDLLKLTKETEQQNELLKQQIASLKNNPYGAIVKQLFNDSTFNNTLKELILSLLLSEVQTIKEEFLKILDEREIKLEQFFFSKIDQIRNNLDARIDKVNEKYNEISQTISAPYPKKSSPITPKRDLQNTKDITRGCTDNRLSNVQTRISEESTLEIKENISSLSENDKKEYYRFIEDIKEAAWFKTIVEITIDCSSHLNDMSQMTKFVSEQSNWEAKIKVIEKENESYTFEISDQLNSPKPKMIYLFQKNKPQWAASLVLPREYKLYNDKQLASLLGLDAKKQYEIQQILFPAIFYNHGNYLQLCRKMETKHREI